VTNYNKLHPFVQIKPCTI